MLRSLALGVAMAVVAACGSAPPSAAPASQSPSPSAPLLVHGGVVDRAGEVIAGATVRIQLLEHEGLEPGDVVPVVFAAETTTSPEGVFAFHVAPDEEIRRLAAANQGTVNFHLDAFAEGHGVFFPSAFDRVVLDDGWRGDAPGFLIRPDRVETLP